MSDWTLQVVVLPFRAACLGFPFGSPRRFWRWRVDVHWGAAALPYMGSAAGLEETEHDARAAAELAKADLADLLRGLEET